jgi:hypothetical protein
MCLCSVGIEDTGTGVNPAILCRLALQYQESVEEVVGVMENSTIYYGCNLVTVDHSGKGATIERSYSHINVRWASDPHPEYVDGDGILAATGSVFVSREMQLLETSAPRYISSDYRYIRLCQLLHQYKGEIDMDVMKLIDGDHYDVSIGEINPSPNTICRHNNPDTIASCLYDVTTGDVWVAYGHPCEGQYTRYRISAKPQPYE